MHNAIVLYVSVLVQGKDDAVAELLLVGTQRADEVAEALGQHRDGAIDEIDAGGTLDDFLVDDRALLHIVADISYMDTYFVELATCRLALELTERQGIIEVLGIFGVDGTSPHVSEVLTALDFLGSDARFNLVGSLLHVLGIPVRQSVLRQDGVHLHVVVALLA